MCGRTCGNSTLHSRRRTRESPSHAPWQLGQYAFWPYKHREILKKAAQCNLCTDFGKNLKPFVPASKWKPLLNCSEHNEEINIDFDGPITNEKNQNIHFLACIDRFSKYPTVEVLSLIKLTDII